MSARRSHSPSLRNNSEQSQHKAMAALENHPFKFIVRGRKGKWEPKIMSEIRGAAQQRTTNNNNKPRLASTT